MALEKIRDTGHLSSAQQSLREQFWKRYEASVSRYKYQAFDKLVYLSADKLFISDPGQFNDPFDLKLTFEDDSSSGGFPMNALQRAFASALEEWPHISDHWFYDADTFEAMKRWATTGLSLVYVEQAIQKRFQKFGVACFSTESNQPLMWSHYGSSHKGMCLQYFVRPMTLALDQRFLQYPVNYTTTLPSIPLTEALFSPRNVGQRILATKSIDWAYEKEWRLIDFSSKGEAVAMPRGMELGSIIIGLSAGGEERAKAFDKGIELQIPVFQVNRAGYDFFLDVTWPLIPAGSALMDSGLCT